MSESGCVSQCTHIQLGLRLEEPVPVGRVYDVQNAVRHREVRLPDPPHCNGGENIVKIPTYFV